MVTLLLACGLALCQAQWREDAHAPSLSPQVEPPVVRFYLHGSRAEESEAYRRELGTLPTGHDVSWYACALCERGFEVLESYVAANGRPRLTLRKNGLLFELELTCDSRGRAIHLDAGPNL